ncbi:MAG: GntR family transcriptional regulator, partial [Bacteroidales bacterium]|nr:GntR family transcriptional regulator [Bacteroidales bacterium]
LEMSKKTFKKAIGSLYKSKLINITEQGIFLL